jgi:3-phenylpropionate/trans-cinnamate dioxygenase ferredoxin reductase component
LEKGKKVINYNYLIVGGGMTADAAVRGIRSVDPGGTIGMISAEAYLPYNRPPLTKALWKGKAVDTIWRGTDKRNVDIHLERRVTEIRPSDHQVMDERGDLYGYAKLLVATGGKPRRLPFGGQDILYYRSLSHYYALREQAERLSSFAVIGGGFIGSELAAALRMNAKEVNMLLREKGIGAGKFPQDLVDFLGEFYLDKGVNVFPGASLTGLEKTGSKLKLTVENGADLLVDGVVAGLGVEPNTELAKAAGIQVENGIVVNETLQTNLPDIFAAGDVASFFNPGLDMRLRVEHEDNANQMGEAAGLNMAGQVTPYTYLPYFYSDLFEIGYEAIGLLDTRLQVIADWQDPYRKGVVYYLDEGRVRGVLLWNVWGKVDAARDLIYRAENTSPAELIGKLT